MIARVRGSTWMHLHLPFPRAAAVSRAFLALAACAACASSAARPAGTPAAGQQDAANAAVPIRVPLVVDWQEAMPRLRSLFPPAALQAGTTQGHASLKFRVLTDSTVDAASIMVEGQSSPEFAQPAKEFIARTRFAPATVGGRPVAAWMRYTVFFQDPRVRSSSGTYELGGFEEPPVLLNGRELPGLVRTHYPPVLRDAGVAGSVLVRFDVSPTGEVEPDGIRVELTTDLALEEPAVAIVRMLRFRPARLRGSAVKGWVTMPLHFGQVPAAR